MSEIDLLKGYKRLEDIESKYTLLAARLRLFFITKAKKTMTDTFHLMGYGFTFVYIHHHILQILSTPQQMLDTHTG